MQQLQASKLNFRMLESIIKDKMMVYFDTNHLFYEQQHGFHPRISCVTQLQYRSKVMSKLDPRELNTLYLYSNTHNANEHRVVNHLRLIQALSIVFSRLSLESMSTSSSGK